MICTQDIDRLYYPEIGNKVVNFCRERQFYVNSIHCIIEEMLRLLEKLIKLIAILCMWWPVDLYG